MTSSTEAFVKSAQDIANRLIRGESINRGTDVKWRELYALAGNPFDGEPLNALARAIRVVDSYSFAPLTKDTAYGKHVIDAWCHYYGQTLVVTASAVRLGSEDVAIRIRSVAKEAYAAGFRDGAKSVGTPTPAEPAPAEPVSHDAALTEYYNKLCDKAQKEYTNADGMSLEESAWFFVKQFLAANRPGVL